MAWPFKKQAKRTPKSHAAPRTAAKKTVNLESIKARLARLESQLAKSNNNFISLQKEHAELFNADAALTKKLKEVSKTGTAVSKVDAELNALCGEVDEERRAFNKEITPLFDADAENKKRLKNLELVNNSIRAECVKLANKQAAFEKSWNPSVLKRVSETLGSVNKVLADIEKRDSKNVRILDRVHAGISAISKHASHIEAEHTDAKFAARELADKAKNLKETVDYFFKNTESLNNRINTNTAGLTDLTNILDTIKDKILALENQSAQLAKINDALEQNSKNIDHLIQKVAYLEKATVKTIVLE